jgi:hypothetical protein
VILLLALLALPLAAAGQGRVVAVGDIHGDLDSFVAILRQAKLIDGRNRWTGGNTTLVQTGDFLDRGTKDRAVMDLLMELQKQAARQGGRVVVLLGNHEAMNMIGDLRYVSPASYASHIDNLANAEQRRRAAYELYRDWMRDRARARKQPMPAFTRETDKAWMDAHPLGYIEHRDALGPTGKYGRWLRGLPAAAQVGDTLFVHGGLSTQVKGVTVEQINQRVAEELNVLDRFRQYLVAKGITLGFSDFAEIITAVKEELDNLEAKFAHKEAEAAAAGKTFVPSGDDRKHKDILEDLMRHPGWFIINPEGPLWFRGYAIWTDEEGPERLAATLDPLGAAHIVVSHTPQSGGRIQTRFGGKVFLIDTGMLSSYYTGGRASALEIANGRFTAIYLDQTAVLWDRGAPTPASGTEEELEEAPGGGLAVPSEWVEPGPAGAPAGDALPRTWLDKDGNALPFKSDEEILEFMRTAKVIEKKDIGKGITQPKRLVLEKEGVRMRAKYTDYVEEKDKATLRTGEVEIGFRDTYVFEPAAYELALLLGFDNVPPTTVRKVQGLTGAVQAWVENTMNEGDRQKQKLRPPDVHHWNRQVQMMHIFDELLYNTDRNAGNILIDREWKLWMIDHTRAFRRHTTLKDPGRILTCERRLWEKLRALDAETVKEQLKPYLRSTEIEGILKRRDLLVAHIQKLIAERGEDEVLFTLKPAAAPAPAIP